MNGSEPIGWVIIEFVVIFFAASVLLSIIAEICAAVAFRITRREESHILAGILYFCVTAIIAGCWRLNQSHIFQAQDAATYWQYWAFWFFAGIAATTTAAGVVYLVCRTIHNLWTGMIDAIRGDQTARDEFPNGNLRTTVPSSARIPTPDLVSHS